MKLQTRISIEIADVPLDYNSKILLLGSCFSAHMGAKLKTHQFQVWQNPFGIIFNPKSIERLIYRAVTNDFFTEADVLERDGFFFCWDTHSQICSKEKNELLTLLHDQLSLMRKYLEQATHFILTLGTSWVYTKKPENRVVANCHKQPSNHFQKEILEISDIKASLHEVVGLIKKINPAIQVMLAVSPVRHLKDGFIENQQSKAHLIAAIHRFLSENKNGNSTYFPSYEIMMDELRDYRFYGRDMLHPNELAIDYIWEKFKTSNISPLVEPIMKEVLEVQKGLAHKPFHPNSEAHDSFKKTLDEKIAYLQKRFPFMKFDT